MGEFGSPNTADCYLIFRGVICLSSVLVLVLSSLLFGEDNFNLCV